MTSAAAPAAASTRADIPNDLAAFWLPFTPNRAFKKRPRLIARSKDMHYFTPEGREILDATAALWCCNAGHNRGPIVAAIQRQAAELDFSPTFQFAHPMAFNLSSRLAELAPADLDHVFFTNSGSEAADTALKIGIAYHNVRGQGALEGIVGLHDASTIAAVIVEPMAGSPGVLPAPKGYLQRLREICDKYGILLIFDEVITGFGRLGAPFAAERYGVVPDMITFAKGVTSGTVPMGGVIVRKHVYDAFMNGPEHAIELFHGYTYSGHPLACAAGLASLDVYRDERLFERAKALEPKWGDAIMGLKNLPNVVDIRCVGLTGAIDLAPITGQAGERGYKVLEHSFHEAGVMLRLSGDTIELTPPLVVSENEIGEIMDKTAASIKAAA